MEYGDFKELIWQHYYANKRSLPWTENTDPYWIVVSEIMLQQTQVDRVLPKFNAFIATFPNFTTLANAPLSDVLTLWSGLGYNRRARFLHELAKQVMTEHGGILPNIQEELVRLPGIGPNTAGAIQAYAFNTPVAYIETNIRTVYLYCFFPDQTNISDSELLPLIEATVDHSNPREWYWALMRYGVHLKKTTANPSRGSKHHAQQSKFEGSRRQLRGKVIKLLTEKSYSEKELDELLLDTRLRNVLLDLRNDGLIIKNSKSKEYSLPL